MKGKIIVIDGMDAVGKNTQSILLYKKLQEQGHKVKLFSFPNYQDDSSFFIKKFLNGEYKDINNPYTISLFYAVDRAITFIREIKEKYDQGYIIILDRYYISSILYQLHNLKEYTDKMLYMQYIGIVEVEGNKLPIPDMTIILYAQPEVSDRLLNKRYNNDDSKRDINENINTQRQVYNNILFVDKFKNLTTIRKTFGDIVTINISDENYNGYNIKSINTIHDEIMDIVKDIIEK